MKLPCLPRMSPWPPPARAAKRKQRGATTLVTVFLYFIFSTLGLGMLYLTEVYLRLSAYKRNVVLLDCASENGVKYGLSHLLNLLSQSASPALLSPEEADELLERTRNQGVEVVEKILGQEIPLRTSQGWERLSWNSTADFTFEKIEEKESYFKAFYTAFILSEGKIKNFKQKRESCLEASLGIIAGHIPITSIPFLKEEKPGPGQEENPLETDGITFTPAKKNLIQPQIMLSEGDLLPRDARSQLQKALKVKFFDPLALPLHILRRALGLEESGAPVPEGVYLIRDDLGLGGIYVQGDLEEMVLAIEEDFQVVSLRNQQGCWVLRFNPRKIKTVFTTPEETQYFDLIPRGIIIVDGEIRSLGGGIIDPSGQALLITDEEIPSILNGVNLTIISPDKITISSHLIHQGMKWIDKVPYLKDSKSQLSLFVTGKDLFGESEREGKIVIDGDAPEELKIQASLTASGEGFSVEGERKSVHILGSIQAAGFSPNKNAINLTCDERLQDDDFYLQDAPQTAKPILFLSFFKPLRWKES
ncbi:MAG: hypothetical protein OEY25_09905 [Candidatus Aminicenantes bacterium]|nr:hypothetical protein [Candidatus Aminicenantes bacterium]